MSKCVLVTGGSGALGRAIVRKFCAEGDQVSFTYHHNEPAAQALAEDTGAQALRVDLTNAADVQSTVNHAIERMGSIDVLVNNAGATQVMPFALIDEEDWDQIIAANLKSMFLVSKEVVRDMVAHKSGTIVNIGSLAGHRMLEVPVHYATAKAGVTGFTISLAAELQRYGIRVNAVVPGLLEGGIARNVPEKELQDFLSHCAAKRPGTMEEVAELVYFVASDKASYINAQCISIDGGL